MSKQCEHLGANGVSAIRKQKFGHSSTWCQCLLCAKIFSEDEMSAEHWQRPCESCGKHTLQHVAHKDDMRPFYALCDGCLEEKVKPTAFLKSVKLPTTFVASAPMKNGDVRKLPKSNSGLFTEQWAAQGTAKVPYIVTRQLTSGAIGALRPYGENYTDNGWACGCSDFTQHTPRAECKHIIRVQKKEGMLGTYSPSGTCVTGVSAEQAEAFKKFMAAEHAKKLVAIANEDGGIKMLGDDQGRRFR
jgi:hypothetical protein